MSMIIDGTNGLTFNNATTQASAGCVLQVVQGTSITQVSTTSTSFVTTGLSASITPKFSTSKIAVYASLPVRCGASGKTVFVTLYRNSTNLGLGTYSCFSQFYAPSSDMVANVPIDYIDSPATTSSTTYTIYFNANDSQTAIAMNNTVTGVITLMEIAG
jgi:hypothetical protein